MYLDLFCLINYEFTSFRSWVADSIDNLSLERKTHAYRLRKRWDGAYKHLGFPQVTAPHVSESTVGVTQLKQKAYGI